MAIPSKAIGAGQIAAANVFSIVFSQALSTAPKYEAWDNSSTFPARDASGTTTAKEVFTGTAGNSSKPELAIYDGWNGTTATPPAASWMPASATGGSANPNRLKGTTNYVTAAWTPTAGNDIRFNMNGEFPFDSTVPSTSSQNYLLQIRYTYTGTAPTLTYRYNDGGTEATPVWTTWVPGTNGMRHVNTGTSAGTYKLTLPTSGVVNTGEIWVTV
jgi:hypothetical protein